MRAQHGCKTGDKSNHGARILNGEIDQDSPLKRQRIPMVCGCPRFDNQKYASHAEELGIGRREKCGMATSIHATSRGRFARRRGRSGKRRLEVWCPPSLANIGPVVETAFLVESLCADGCA